MTPEAEAATEEKSGNDAIGAKYKEKYGKDKHCGDDVAILMKAFCLGEKNKIDPEKLAQVASDNGLDIKKWAHLNIGMQRMTVGNILRGMHNKGKDITIGEDVVEGAETETD